MGHSEVDATLPDEQREKTCKLPLQRSPCYTSLQHWAPVLRKAAIGLLAGGALAAVGALSSAPSEQDLRSLLDATETRAGIVPDSEWLSPLDSTTPHSAASIAHSSAGDDKRRTTCECCGGTVASMGDDTALGARTPSDLGTVSPGGFQSVSTATSPGSATSSGGATSSGSATSSGGATPKLTDVDDRHSGVLPDGRVVLNTATVAELMTLPGIGPARAAQITELRQRLGRFRKLSDLLRIKGIGVKSLRKLTPHVTLDHRTP